jgi:hypothetical protein
MGLKAALESILRLGNAAPATHAPPVSMVLLLRAERFPNLEQLRDAAEKAYGRKFSGDKSSAHCVYQQILFTLARVGPHTLSFMFYTKPYDEEYRALGNSWALPNQRTAWAEHTAWIAVDYAKGELDLEARYALLARFCAELYDDNCVGVYLPREGAFIPGASSVRNMLSRAIASRNVDIE